jgi:hypothetical protein
LPLEASYSLNAATLFILANYERRGKTWPMVWGLLNTGYRATFNSMSLTPDRRTRGQRESENDRVFLASFGN